METASYDALTKIVDFLTLEQIVEFSKVSKRLKQFFYSPKARSSLRRAIEKYYPRGKKYISPGREFEYIEKIVSNPVEQFFRDYIDRVDWIELSGNPSLSEQFFREHIDRVDWAALSRNPNLSEQFFRDYIDRVDWRTLSRNPSLSEQFFREHIDRVDWRTLSRNPVTIKL